MSVQSEVLATLSEILDRADLGGIAYCDLTSTVKTIRFRNLFTEEVQQQI